MANNGAAKRKAVKKGSESVGKDGEISDADAWELRYAQASSESRGLKDALLDAQGVILTLRRRVAALESEKAEAEEAALFRRMGLRGGDELVMRDGRPTIVRAPREKSGPAGRGAGTMPTSGGAPEREDAGGE